MPDELSTPSLGITHFYYGQIVNAVYLAFNSLSRDHTDGLGEEHVRAVGRFQLPLSGSLSVDDGGRWYLIENELSTPSLGITDHLAPKRVLSPALIKAPKLSTPSLGIT